jgi:hypothetical protein
MQALRKSKKHFFVSAWLALSKKICSNIVFNVTNNTTKIMTCTKTEFSKFSVLVLVRVSEPTTIYFHILDPKH